MSTEKYPFLVHAYFASRAFQERILYGAARFLEFQRALHNGIWLGLLEGEGLHQVDEWFYRSDRMYFDDNFNKKGFFPWETKVVERYFPPAGKIFVLGAGGGREIHAFRRRGSEAEGCECNPDLVRFANDLLEREGLAPSVCQSPRDGICPISEHYDAVVIGWAVYTLIQGRSRRIELLKRIRNLVDAGAPILLSFFHRDGDAFRFRTAAGTGNFLRRLTRKEPLERGDFLAPNFVHYFTREELEAELREGGFALQYHSTEGCGHAAGSATH